MKFDHAPHDCPPPFHWRPLAFGLGLLVAQLTLGVRAEETVKLRVENPAVTTTLQVKRATVVADYGSYQVVSAPVSAAAAAADDPAVQLREEDSFIELNSGPLDTRRPEVQSLRKALPAFSGKRLHLVQFAGPVKTEWHDELRNHGVQVVTYLPRNAYLVYGDAPALGRLQNAARTAKHVQWEGAFLDDHKIHPRARTVAAKGAAPPPTEDLYSIQLVADPTANAASLRVIEALQLEPAKQTTRVKDYLNIVVKLPAARLAEVAARPDVVSIHRFVVPSLRKER